MGKRYELKMMMEEMIKIPKRKQKSQVQNITINAERKEKLNKPVIKYVVKGNISVLSKCQILNIEKDYPG